MSHRVIPCQPAWEDAVNSANDRLFWFQAADAYRSLGCDLEADECTRRAHVAETNVRRHADAALRGQFA